MIYVRGYLRLWTQWHSQRDASYTHCGVPLAAWDKIEYRENPTYARCSSCTYWRGTKAKETQ